MAPAASKIVSDSSASTPGSFVNVAAYLFVPLDNLQERKTTLRKLCRELSLKGTILLSPEGINLFIAGSRSAVDLLLEHLRSDPALSNLEVKESFSDDQPFERMLVKIKPEIIAFGIDGINPARKTSRKISAPELKDWIESGRDLVLLDVRNNFEVRVGTFDDALPVNVDHFRDFPEAIEQLPEDLRERPVVMFCTGGIRCEKAGPLMERAGFRNIFQLNGGILKYFEEVGGDHYHGECFVFDKRVALDPELKPTATQQCYACLQPLSVEDQQSPHYDPPHTCPHCFQTEEQKRERLLAKRHAAIQKAVTPLPGSTPYDNPRPLNVRERFAGLTLLEFVKQNHPHLGAEYWEEVCRSGRIHQHGQPVSADRIVRPGEQFAHLSPASIEPDVNGAIEILHEDDALVVVNKPAPLPCHPSGRFNRNTLQWILNEVYSPLKLRPPHRLDANTTGVVVLCKTRTMTQKVHAQFEAGTVEKFYLARVQGLVPWENCRCEAPISAEPTECGGRSICENGLPSHTVFERLHQFEDGTTLVRAQPITGRTNQIRVHLWHLGFPVVGDPLYLPEQQMGQTQTHATGGTMCLHAASLKIVHPLTGEEVTYQAPTPAWAEVSGQSS
ncbi:sulfurtransferase [Planctomicrobium sp. SH661]|uniref:sulfurtransferase n=1 Tax=Planctomicrobium sp. SH661 TaxID=3448124 RepID=UPI003F5C391A